MIANSIYIAFLEPCSWWWYSLGKYTIHRFNNWTISILDTLRASSGAGINVSINKTLIFMYNWCFYNFTSTKWKSGVKLVCSDLKKRTMMRDQTIILIEIGFMLKLVFFISWIHRIKSYIIFIIWNYLKEVKYVCACQKTSINLHMQLLLSLKLELLKAAI